MGKSKFSLKEKSEMIIINLKNLVFLNLEKNEVEYSCPICGNEFKDSIQSTWARMFYQSSGELREYFLEDEQSLACKIKTCTCKLSQRRPSVKKKIEKTCINKYGESCYLKKEESKNLCKEAIIKKYGSYQNKFKKSWETYKEKTGYSHNMKNPESIRKNQDARIKTILNMSKEQKETWFQNRINSHKKNHTQLFGENCSSYCVSKIQIELFEILEKMGLSIQFGKHEKIVWINDINYYRIDGFLPEKNIAIEFFGDYWHANPIRYSADSILSHPKGKITAKEVWEKDKIRQQNIVNTINCKFIIIWESEFRNNKEKVVENILKEINE